MELQPNPGWFSRAARLAWRDAGRFMVSVQVWGVVAGVAVVTGYAGPFGTAETTPLAKRLVYWSLIIAVSVPLMSWLSFLGHRLNDRGRVHWVAVAGLAGAAGVPLLTAAVIVLHALLFPADPRLDPGRLLLEVGVPVILINVLVNAYVTVPGRDNGRAGTPAVALAGPAPATAYAVDGDPSLFFDSLPAELGRDVVCIEADDHYIEVTTTLGKARLLMRLRDAELSLTTVPGMRVHRSWWVNLSQVAAMERASGGAGVLTLTTGDSVPVARSQRASVEAALDARP